MWGEERIANELLVKLGIWVSPRTVRKYMPKLPPAQPRGDQRWSTFLKTHAKAILACDFFVAVTATFRMLYVFVVIEQSTRRLAHINVTAHPNADWTLQQLREVVRNGGGYRYLIHDRDPLFTAEFVSTLAAAGVQSVKLPPRSPNLNPYAERFVRSIKESCLERLILFGEEALRKAVLEFVAHYHHERSHQGIGNVLILPDPKRTQRNGIVERRQLRHVRFPESAAYQCNWGAVK